MASKYWLKLYYEILDDPKMGRLPDRTWRRVIEFFLMAGELDLDGVLPSTADMAWRLRITEDELMDTLKEMASIGILTDNGGRWIVTQFAERQAPVDNAERQRRYRERKRKGQYYGNEALPETITDEVTKSVTNTVTKRNADTDTDTEEDLGADAPIPTTLSEWQAGYLDASNQAGYIGVMLNTLYPAYYANHKPNYGFIGKLRKKHDPDYMLSLIWQHSARPPAGDPLRFVSGILSKEPSNGSGVDGWKLHG